MLLQLKYTKQVDEFQTVTILGNQEGIRDLYWQLTKNCMCFDGTGIKDIHVLNLEGEDITEMIMASPWQRATKLSNLY